MYFQHYELVLDEWRKTSWGGLEAPYKLFSWLLLTAFVIDPFLFFTEGEKDLKVMIKMVINEKWKWKSLLCVKGKNVLHVIAQIGSPPPLSTPQDKKASSLWQNVVLVHFFKAGGPVGGAIEESKEDRGERHGRLNRGTASTDI